MVVAYFFAEPLIDYTKLIEHQSKVKSIDMFARAIKKH
jgi:hypothetical protein